MAPISVPTSAVLQSRAGGVNDAPALARASRGIAMRAAGGDAVIETADVALMSDELSMVAWLIAHSRATLAVIRQNIIAALSVKAVFVALTLAGRASLMGGHRRRHGRLASDDRRRPPACDGRPSRSAARGIELDAGAEVFALPG